MSALANVIGIDIGGTSTKIAHRSEDGLWRFVSSSPYAEPDRGLLIAAVREALCDLSLDQVRCAGLCLPGRMNADCTAIECSLNLPALNGWLLEELLAEIGISGLIPYVIQSDANAAGFDWVTEQNDSEAGSELRTAAISLGTGVGLCILDGSLPVGIASRGIGHLGQVDVGRCDREDRHDPSGARNTLETYIGLRSMGAFQAGDLLDLAGLNELDPPIRALVHALRLVHAVYCPERVVLLGGVGLALRPLRSMIHAAVSDGLTTLAKDHWSLEFADNSFHAARGMAKLASLEL